MTQNAKAEERTGHRGLKRAFTDCHQAFSSINDGGTLLHYHPRSDTLNDINRSYTRPYAVAETIHRGYRKDLYDVECFTLLFQTLSGVAKDSTSDALKASLPVRWQQPYDTIYPYGDSRQVLVTTVWTFNLDSDTLLFSNINNSGQLSLSILRQRPVTFDDFTPCKVSSPPVLEVRKDFPPPYWEPVLQVQERNKAFTRRVLNDFNFQWRHILRSRYNDLAFRKLAHAIVRITTMDLKIVELTKSRQGLGGALVGILDLPEWEPIDGDVVKVGRVWVAASQDPADSVPLIRKHLATQRDKVVKCEYMILSVRHIILCRVPGDKLEWTEPELFLDGKSTYPGQSTYADRVLELLLWATSPDPSPTLIHKLPVEIQDRILGHLSQGPVEAAIVGCVLGLGSSFLWKDGRMEIASERVHRGRTPFSPAESQIWFDDHKSGVSYKGDVRTSPQQQVIT
ncbi:hypothetical protein MMC30_005258 [Trapelia coarctata]|nr:hypothetical protein [Trapelia coarctata]